MDINVLKHLLEEVRAGQVPVAAAVERLRTLPFEDLGFARVDHHRQLRQSFPEVVFAAGKSLKQIRGILTSLSARSDQILMTRLAPEKAAALAHDFPEARYYPDSQAWTLSRGAIPDRGRGLILVISAGTSDIPVSEEALVTAQIMGHRAEALYDVGVAGLHRLLAHQDLLTQATCFIVVAGMEGALPSVVAGLVDRPVVAVPTSIGYGASFGGLAALLAMLNSCATGLAVVNIDNGFGAGYLAAMINRQDQAVTKNRREFSEVPWEWLGYPDKREIALMDTAIIGLLGAMVGGLITLLVALINNRKELALKEKEFQLKSRELEIANRNKNREEKLSKYSNFLGAFQLVLGYLGEVVDIIQQERTLERRNNLVSEIVDHPHYEEAIRNLNEGCGWINVLSDTNEITDKIFELQEKFDIFVPFLATLRNQQEISDKRSELYKELDDLKEIYKSLVKLMQSELKIPNN